MFSNDLQQTEGLGMIILEGSHKVLGKGIFVTDIQKGSLAMRVSIAFAYAGSSHLITTIM